MSGSLWLTNGTMRDALPPIPRQRTTPARPTAPATGTAAASGTDAGPGAGPGPASGGAGAAPGRGAAPDAGSASRPGAGAAHTATPGPGPAGPGPGPASGTGPAGPGPASGPGPAGPGPGPASGTGPASATGTGPASGTGPAPAGARVLAADPLDELAARLDALTAAAVHPDEIAAILESDGMTDDHIRLTYGRADSFALAEDLYARTERRHPAPEAPPAGPWYTGLAGCLLRGLVFALPGLAYVLGAPLLATGPGRHGLPPGAVPLIAGAVTGWVWNQALAHRAYSWLGLGDRRAAVRALLTGAPAGALAGAVVAALAARPGEGPAALFGAGQALYLAAATVLLVLGRERALLCALLPLAGAVPAFRHDLPDALRVLLLLLSLTATVTFAALVLRPGARRPGAARPARGRAGPPLAASLPYGLFGLGSGLLVLYAGADAVIALTLSMGPAEWLLHRFRGTALARLRLLTTARAFRRAVTATLARCLVGYLAVLFVLSVTAALLWPGAAAVSAPRTGSLLLVGAVLWLGLLLQAFGAVAGAAAVCLLAATAQALAPAAGTVAAGAAATVLGVLTCALLVRPTAHRI
ncbi:hypothetical protein [Streptomyces roseoviridis]|uniref:Uncharacterized protein n=1 Tax=Streptomyces roseoviridis TaxID=67361 RepID=A0ABV5QMU9_9ACTN